jgi:plastocyanin
MRHLKQLIPLAFFGALASCSNSMYGSSGGYGSNGSCTPTATQVCMVMTSFSPMSRTVAAGTTVTFINGDGFNHTTTSSSVPSGASSWNTTVGAGSSTSVMLSVKGTYQYYCTIHGTPTTGMRGTITVN